MQWAARVTTEWSRRLGETTGRVQQAEDAWEKVGAGGKDTGASRYQEQRGRENWHQERGRRARPVEKSQAE